ATGVAPFDSKTPLAVLRRVSDETQMPLVRVNHEVPQWLSDAVDKLLQKDPADRHQTASEVAEVFAAGLAEMHLLSPLDVPAEVCAAARTAATRAPRQPICWKAVGCRVLPWAGGAALGALAVGLLWLATDTGAPTPPPDPDPHPGATAPPASDPGPQPQHTLYGKSGTGTVWATAFLPENHLVMGTEDGSLKIWDLRNGELIKQLDKQDGNIWTADVSSDGKFLVTAADESDVTFWNLKTFRREFPLPESTWTKVAVFSPNGQYLATGNRSGLVRVWDWNNGIPYAQLRGHKGTIHAIAYSADGSRIASAGSNGVVKVWDLKAGEWETGGGPPATLDLTLHVGAVHAVAFGPDGSRIASAGWDGSVRVWDAVKGTQIHRIAAHEGDVWSLAFGAGGKWIASAGSDGYVKVWDVETSKEVFSYRTGRAVHVVRFAADGTTLAAGGRDGNVRVWDLKK
ncbi:MAG: hypothetical protein ACKODX_21755, partial [Gemmata sp.]